MKLELTAEQRAMVHSVRSLVQGKFKPRVKKCWVCGGTDEREHNPKLKVLCWEDIDL